MKTTRELRGRAVTHKEAAASARRLVNSHFNNKDSARVSIPAQMSDDDLVVTDYIEEQRAKDVRYFIGHDNSGHDYVVPVDQREDWELWAAIPEDDPMSWDSPLYAERIDGTFTFTDPRIK